MRTPKTAFIGFRITEDLKRAFMRRLEREDIEPSDFLRETIKDYAKK